MKEIPQMYPLRTSKVKDAFYEKVGYVKKISEVEDSLMSKNLRLTFLDYLFFPIANEIKFPISVPIENSVKLVNYKKIIEHTKKIK